MNADLARLPDDTAELKNIIFSLQSIQEKNQSRIEFLEERIRLLQKELFGRKTEKQPKPDQQQLLLFDEENADDPDDAPETVAVPAHNRKKRGRKPLPEELPRIEVVLDIDESEKVCGCGCELSHIGNDTSEKLEIIPAKIQVIRYVRKKYACKNCEGVEGDGPTVKIASLPPQIIPKSIATPGLLAHIVVAKFEDALPFYRQEKILQRMGVDIPRSTLCNWSVKVADEIKPIMKLLQDEIRSGPLINIDETPVQVLKEPGRSNTSKSYMWVYRGGDPGKPVLLYQYHPTRSGQVALSFLEGYRGYIQTDGYSGYDALEKKDGILLLGCWAHVRRKFFEVIKAKSGKKKEGVADKALKLIADLYRIEKQAMEKNLDPDAVYRLRQEEAKPILDKFHKWLQIKADITPPRGLLGIAVNYALKNWDRLIRYIDDGRLRPDNNLAENAIRPFVVGRKNWLFSGSPNGASASASLYSLIETAKANGLRPYEYLRFLFEKLPYTETEQDYKNLLPWNIDSALLNCWSQNV
ncbi:MAG: IS66 family transposase [Thermodesulfobacteriota bacterium]